MYGLGILRGLGVTLKHFVTTYVNDIRGWGTRYSTDEGFLARQSAQASGIFTVQYPEEKLASPERYRFVPFLIMNNLDDPAEPGRLWCTSCGICAKACPPQCIWIVRSTDPKTGRPRPEPAEFYIDIDICMNCGSCAEFCPFDAIKMDHNYEMATYDRKQAHILDKERLAKELRYWEMIAPTVAEKERLAREEKTAAKTK